MGAAQQAGLTLNTGVLKSKLLLKACCVTHTKRIFTDILHIFSRCENNGTSLTTGYYQCQSDQCTPPHDLIYFAVRKY